MGIGIVKTKYGDLQGVQKQNHTVFRGIPYAKAPTGNLRWKAPREPDSWEGIREAKVFGNRSMQGVSEPGSFYHKEFFSDEDFMPAMSEDCLYLNIWTPASGCDEKLPVGFWIHGGGFTGGFGTEIEFDGGAFCERNVILVTINYRLGALGFLAHEELCAENENAVSGNYGLLDQIRALTWVFENIHSFGGDPERITIFGQSAGCLSVQALVSSRLTKGMIAGAILQSAGGYHTGIGRDVLLEEAKQAGRTFMEFCGKKSITELRDLSSEEINDFSNRFLASPLAVGPLPFSPCVDGYILEKGFDEIVDKGMHHDIPYMIGSTADDLGSEQTPPGEKSQLYKGCIDWSLKNEALGRNPSYVYYFTRAPLNSRESIHATEPSDLYGSIGLVSTIGSLSIIRDSDKSYHSAELWYVFGTLSRSWRPKIVGDYDLSRRMTTYWCNFIRTGDPNGKFSHWKPYTVNDPFVEELCCL